MSSHFPRITRIQSVGLRISTAFVAILLFSEVRSFAVDDLPPPLGFHWNDRMANIERVLGRAKGKIVNRERKEKREIWTVENINQPGLQRCLFTFFDGSLIQLELQYEYPDRNIEWYNQRIHDIRTYWDAKFGIPGKLITRSRDLDSDVIQTLLGYQWIVGQTTLELFYFSAEHDKQFFRTISYTYKAPFPGSR